MAKSIMIQGAGSNVGKSIIVAGLARAYLRRGLKVAPFKPQNMSNNAAVTVDGGEIGRAQALQAKAAGLDPVVDMNPVLLKPESDLGAQIIVQGQRVGTMKARDYGSHKANLMPKVLESFGRISENVDLVLVEGAGSPAEINLRDGDIANMGFAEAANVPVILIGDIDRGGVIAQIVGTHAVLSQPDVERIKAFAINKFRGDPSLFDDGLREISSRTEWQSIGVIPWFDQAWRLPAEDIMDIANSGDGELKIVVPRLGRIANFDDLDPLSCDPNCRIEIIEPGIALPGDADLVLIPGSKSTIADLVKFRENGWDIDLFTHVRRGGHVLGICGGFQMLGKSIEDPNGIEGPAGKVAGLGLLDVTTVMTPEKHLSKVQGNDLRSGNIIEGYEIHIGETAGPDCENAWLEIENRPAGATSANGRIRGCYVHGLFSTDQFRSSFLQELGATAEIQNYDASVERTLDALAAHLEENLDLDLLLDLSSEI